MLNPPILSPNCIFLGQFVIDENNDVLGPEAYMAERGNGLLDLADSGDPEILARINSHVLDGTPVYLAILAVLNDNFDSWVAQRN